MNLDVHADMPQGLILNRHPGGTHLGRHPGMHRDRHPNMHLGMHGCMHLGLHPRMDSGRHRVAGTTPCNLVKTGQQLQARHERAVIQTQPYPLLQAGMVRHVHHTADPLHLEMAHGGGCAGSKVGKTLVSVWRRRSGRREASAWRGTAGNRTSFVVQAREVPICSPASLLLHNPAHVHQPLRGATHEALVPCRANFMQRKWTPGGWKGRSSRESLAGSMPCSACKGMKLLHGKQGEPALPPMGKRQKPSHVPNSI